MMKGVALLSMPFGAHRIPKIGLSLLKGHLSREGLKCDIHLFDLELALRIGFDNYETIAERFDPALLIGDWFFTPELSGANPESDREYADFLLAEISKKQETLALPAILKLLEVRDQIPEYLKDCLHSVDWNKYAIVGLSTSNSQNCACLAMAKLIKEHYPHIKIVFGGANCAGKMAEAMIRSFPFVDFVCQGEGDIPFPLLVKALLQENEVKPGEIPGILCRDGNKPGLYYERARGVSDLDALPYPDYSEYFSFVKNNPVPDTFEPQVPVETSRGCWWGQIKPCVFCGHCLKQDMIFRSKAPKRALDEINYLSKRYVKTIHVSDDIMDYRYYDTLLPELAGEKSDAAFYWEVKANITREHMAALANAGVKRIQPGIESLGENTLKLINKGTTQLINLSTLKWAKQFGVQALWNLIYAFPGEDHTEYEKVIKLMPLLYHLEPPSGYSHVRFERFSSYFKDPGSFGIKSLRPSRIYSLFYRGLDEDNISDLAFYFDAEYDDNSHNYKERLLAEIEKWKKQTQARLDVFSSNGSIKIIDSRDQKGEREFFLKGLKAQVYILCDKARSMPSLFKEPGINQYADEEKIKLILNGFIKEGLMIESNSKYLSLAVTRKREV